MEKKGVKIAAQNGRAHEVKSLRAGTLNLKDSYCSVKDGELFIHGMHISPYEKGNIFNKDPVRVRRLLMHKREIRKLHALVKQDAYTLVPPASSWKWACARAKRTTISGPPWPRGTPSARSTGP